MNLIFTEVGDIRGRGMRPLRLTGVCAAAQVSRLKREVSPEQLQGLYAACQALPVLVATGEQDKLVPPRQVRMLPPPLSATSDTQYENIRFLQFSTDAIVADTYAWAAG